jgi:PKD repeat protein
MLMLVGCSSGSTNSVPTIPGQDQQQSESTSGDSTPELTSGNPEQEADRAASGHIVLSYNMVYVDASDPDEPVAEMVPVRLGSLHLNILKLLEVGPCTNCFKIVGLNFPEPGVLDIGFEITHPFADPTFTVFDCRGIMMFNGAHDFPELGLTMSESAMGDGELINAEGFSSLYNGTTLGLGGDLMSYFQGNLATATVPDSIVNGYLRHNTDDPSNTRNALYESDAVTRVYSIRIPTPEFVFGYAVDANWAMPINQPVEDPMTDFGDDANCPEPWKIEVTEYPIGEGLTDVGGSTALTIDIFDWLGKETHHEPVLECPELFPGTITGLWIEDGPGYSSWQATLSNTNLAPVGEYRCLIRVEDNENEGSPPFLDLSAYQLVMLEVTEHINQPPVAGASADKTEVVVDEIINFLDESTDPDGPEDIIEWEWDFSYVEGDGFQVDSTDQNPTHSYPVEGTYEVNLRVTDTEDQSAYLVEPLQILVTPLNMPPVAGGFADKTDAVPEEPIQFTDDSSDPDGVDDIVLYEWDFSYEPLEGFQMDSEEEDPIHAYQIEGIYTVQHRVTDSAGHKDALDEPIIIEIIAGESDPVAYADFSPQNQTVCNPVHFVDDGSFDPDGGLITQYEWDWDNDGTFDGLGVETFHTWTVPGTYYVQYRVTDDEGATDTLDEPLEVIIENALPTADAYATKYTVAIDEDFYIDAIASHDNDCDNYEIVLYEWDLSYEPLEGFNQELTGVTKLVSYSEAGTFNIMLRVTDDEAGTDLLDESLIIEVSAKTDPIAIADADPMYFNVCVPVNFNGGDSYDPDGGDIVLFEWDWDNDGVFDETGPEITRDFTDMGDLEVQLRVTDDEGMTDTLDTPLSFYVGNGGAEAISSCDNHFPLVGETVNFDGSASYDTDCGGEAIVLYEWDFDHQIDFEVDATGMYVSHAYGEPGIKKALLRVMDDEGEKFTAISLTISVAAGPSAPVAMGYPSSIYIDVGDWVDFEDDSQDPDGDIIIWEWDFSFNPADGFLVESTEQDPSVQFNEAGTFHVNHRVEDATGLDDFLNYTFTIVVGPAESSFPSVFIGCPGWNVKSNNIYIPWNMNDDVTPKADLLVRVWKGSEGPFELAPGSDQWNWTGPIDCGYYTFWVEVEDEHGLKKLARCDWGNWDEDDPTVNIINYPTDPTTSPYFYWINSDDCTYGSDMPVWISKDYGAWEQLPNGTNDYYDWTGVYCPDHSFRVKIKDELGNEGMSEVIFDGWDQPPTVSFTNCPGTTGSSYLFNWNMDDECTAPSALIVEVLRDDYDWELLPAGTTGYAWNSIPCGPHEIVVRVTDEAELEQMAWCNFNGPGVDLPPEVTITNCPGQSGSSHMFEWTLYDECTPTDWLGVEVRLDYNDPWIGLPDGSTSYMWNDINCGAHGIEVHVMDVSSNTDFDECFFQGPGEDLLPEIDFIDCPTSMVGHEYIFNWTLWDDCIPEAELEVSYMTPESLDWEGLEAGTTSFELLDIPCGSTWFKVRAWDYNDDHEPVEAICNFECIGDDPDAWWVPACPDEVYVENYTIEWGWSVDCMGEILPLVDIRKDSGAWEELEPGATEYTWFGLELGSHTVEVRITDIEARQVEIYCDFERI